MFREPRKEATGRKDVKGEELGDLHQRWRQMGRGASGETPGKAAGRMAPLSRGSSRFASMLRGPPAQRMHLSPNTLGLQTPHQPVFSPGHKRGQLFIYEYLVSGCVCTHVSLHTHVCICARTLPTLFPGTARVEASSLPGCCNAHTTAPAPPFLVTGKSDDFWYPG